MSDATLSALHALEAALAAADWEACADAAFLLLHGLPTGAAREVAARALARAWRTLATARPGLDWPSEVLTDPTAWLGRDLPDWPEPALAGELELSTGLDALLAGLGATDRFPATAAFAAAVVAAAEAEATRAWADHDPEAFRAWSTLEDFGEDDEAMALLAGRTAADDSAAEAARGAAWAAAREDLAAAGPIAIDAAAAEADRARWVALDRIAFVD